MQWVATSVSIGTLLLLTQAQEPKQDQQDHSFGRGYLQDIH